MQTRTLACAGRAPRGVRIGAMLAIVVLGGCTAISQDVHRYYSQMAINFREAEEKAQSEISVLEGQARVMLQGGEFRKYNQAQKEIARIKRWQAHCAWERGRFEKAALKMERRHDSDNPQPPVPAGDQPSPG